MMSPGFRLEQTYTEKAIDDLQLFANTYPNSPRLKEVNRLIDEMRLKLEQKVFDEGLLYYNMRQYQAATTTFENLLKDFRKPATPNRCATIWPRLTTCSPKTASSKNRRSASSKPLNIPGTTLISSKAATTTTKSNHFTITQLSN
ncbi:MAG: hypothetical protein IPN76_04080 [Saprospiraceae bacterium]|nr:hypothetical protein [Saprospiraceae bacterium]